MVFEPAPEPAERPNSVPAVSLRLARGCTLYLPSIEDARSNKANAGNLTVMLPTVHATPRSVQSLRSGDATGWTRGALQSTSRYGFQTVLGAPPASAGARQVTADVALRLAHAWSVDLNLVSHVVLKVELPPARRRDCLAPVPRHGDAHQLGQRQWRVHVGAESRPRRGGARHGERCRRALRWPAFACAGGRAMKSRLELHLTCDVPHESQIPFSVAVCEQIGLRPLLIDHHRDNGGERNRQLSATAWLRADLEEAKAEAMALAQWLARAGMAVLGVKVDAPVQDADQLDCDGQYFEWRGKLRQQQCDMSALQQLCEAHGAQLSRDSLREEACTCFVTLRSCRIPGGIHVARIGRDRTARARRLAGAEAGLRNLPARQPRIALQLQLQWQLHLEA